MQRGLEMGEEDIVGNDCVYRWRMRLSQVWMPTELEMSVKYASKRVC